MKCYLRPNIDFAGVLFYVNMAWIKDKRWETIVYYQLNTFDKYTYKFEVVIEGNKAFVALSSGRKRKSLDIFEEKTEKSLVGLSPLFWARVLYYYWVGEEIFLPDFN